MRRAICINGVEIAAGKRLTVDMPVAKLYTHTSLAMPVHVVNGRQDGPRLFISGAIHGDELNGVEIIRRLLKLPVLKRLSGALIAIPIVNVHGFLERSRYLPDRRDLNRSFPGHESGSLASRVSHLFMEEIVAKCTHGIDLHTGGLHRDNLPQVRANLDDPETLKLAEAFGAPVLINANLRDGSLRQAAAEQGMPMLLYEAGEALRFDELSIRAGVNGIVEVMRVLGMLPPSRKKRQCLVPVVARASAWVRAPESGILRAMVSLGTQVEKNTLLGVVADPFGEQELEVRSPYKGIIVGRTNLPLVHEGEALFHIARFQKLDAATASVEEFTVNFDPDMEYPPTPDGPIV
ncbi:MAG: succinylglutamate desuccinylase/aspartoacylase family protein [Thiohalomonadaceae bacterium]